MCMLISFERRGFLKALILAFQSRAMVNKDNDDDRAAAVLLTFILNCIKR